jgi:hypothetical protein
LAMPDLSNANGGREKRPRESSGTSTGIARYPAAEQDFKP